MRRVLSLGLVMTMALVSVPGSARAAAKAAQGQGTGALHGVAHGADRAPLRNYTVRARNVADGQIAGTTMTSQAGEFSFTGLPAGNYIVEVVDAAGKVVGLSPTLGVASGASLSVTINAAAAGAIAGASAGGFSLFGLGTLGSVAVISAAGVAGVTAVVATKHDASPSR